MYNLLSFSLFLLTALYCRVHSDASVVYFTQYMHAIAVDAPVNRPDWLSTSAQAMEALNSNAPSCLNPERVEFYKQAIQQVRPGKERSP
jgi:hypothetical protein